MRDLRIVFMGTPEFAVYNLQKIMEAGFKVVGVVTAPDKPAGRGRKLQESAVKKYAVTQDLPILQPTNLKDPNFLNELKTLNPNVQIVVAFRMLPKQVWQLPKFGTFNLHASLLPQYRGAAPINWAIINGEKTTGVSTFFIDEKIDTGEMILQQEVEITAEDSAGILHDRLMKIGANLTVKTLEEIAKGDVETTRQDEHAKLKDAPKLTRENTKIDWKQPIHKIHDKIRGLNPYPAAWTDMRNGNDYFIVKIFEAEKEFKQHNYETGKLLVEQKELKVAVQEGFLVLKEIQLPGKKKMKTKDLLNGFQIFPNAKVGNPL